MRKVILLTLFNRPLHVVEMCLRSARAVLPSARIYAYDDGSTPQNVEAYQRLLDQLGDALLIRGDTAKARPDAYSIGGHNNPAFAFNECWRAARAESSEPAKALILGSDSLLQSRAREHLREFDTSVAVWTCRVVDLDTAVCWHGPEQPRPFNWAMYTSLEAIEAVGGMDERFLAGIGFEDNDFSARLLLHVGRLIVRGDVVCWHMSHPQTAYSDGGKGFAANKALCESIWNGRVPFNGPSDVELVPLALDASVGAFDVKRSA